MAEEKLALYCKDSIEKKLCLEIAVFIVKVPDY